jgi:hypothetical protein
MEGRVGESQIQRVHRCHLETLRLPRERPVPTRIREHRPVCILVPSGLDVEVGRNDAFGVAGEQKDRCLVSGTDAEEVPAIVEQTGAREGSHRHRDLPVRTPVATVRELRTEASQLV